MSQNFNHQPSSGKGPLYVVIAVLAAMLFATGVGIAAYFFFKGQQQKNVAMTEMNKAIEELEKAKEELEESQMQVTNSGNTRQGSTVSGNGMTGVYYGTIGDDHSAILTLNNGVGTYSYYNGNIVRYIEVQSYTPSGKVVIYAYDRTNGAYVGRLDGVLTSGRIKGVFTNSKGAKVNFDMQ
jgi:hypothetical protein